MKTLSQKEVTQLLIDLSNGDQEALDKLLPLVYEELRRLASSYMRRERSDHTLQPTALVNEAYLRLINQKDVHWQNRAQFFGVAAQVMRRILVDHSRQHYAAKRGGGGVKLALDDRIDVSSERAADLLALDDALTRLNQLDPDQSRIVELRYFGGLSVEETARVMGISAPTVKRNWKMAKLWLYTQIKKE